MEEVWKSRLSRTPLSERQRISSGKVCWESTGEGERGRKRPSKQFYRDSDCRVTFFMLDTPFLLLSLSLFLVWRHKYGNIIENRRGILDVSFALRSRMRSEDGGWSFDYSVSCYLGAINVLLPSKKISKGEDLSFCLYLILSKDLWIKQYDFIHYFYLYHCI